MKEILAEIEKVSKYIAETTFNKSKIKLDMMRFMMDDSDPSWRSKYGKYKNHSYKTITLEKGFVVFTQNEGARFFKNFPKPGDRMDAFVLPKKIKKL